MCNDDNVNDNDNNNKGQCLWWCDTRLRSSSRGDFNVPRTNLRVSDKALILCSWTTSEELFTNRRPLVCHLDHIL